MLQMQHWGHFWDMGEAYIYIYELFWVHKYHPELNWNDLNGDDASLAIYTSHFKLEAVEHPKILFYMAK